jgi:hypothetical protein
MDTSPCNHALQALAMLYVMGHKISRIFLLVTKYLLPQDSWLGLNLFKPNRNLEKFRQWKLF